MRKDGSISPVRIHNHFWFYPLKRCVEFVVVTPNGTLIFKVPRHKLAAIATQGGKDGH